MGYHVLMMAIFGKSPSVANREIGFAPINEFHETPASLINGTQLPSGAYLLYLNNVVPQSHYFEKLSLNATLAACYADEANGSSIACSWENGVVKWMVTYDRSQSDDDFAVLGDFPSQLRTIRDKCMVKQAEARPNVDCFFDLPVELFTSVGGIHYSACLATAGNPNPWQVLDKIEAGPQKKWWPFW